MSYPKTESSTFSKPDELRNWPLNYPSYEVLSPLRRTDLVICEHADVAAIGIYNQISHDFDSDFQRWDLLSDEALINFEREFI